MLKQLTLASALATSSFSARSEPSPGRSPGTESENYQKLSAPKAFSDQLEALRGLAVSIGDTIAREDIYKLLRSLERTGEFYGKFKDAKNLVADEQQILDKLKKGEDPGLPKMTFYVSSEAIETLDRAAESLRQLDFDHLKPKLAPIPFDSLLASRDQSIVNQAMAVAEQDEKKFEEYRTLIKEWLTIFHFLDSHLERVRQVNRYFAKILGDLPVIEPAFRSDLAWADLELVVNPRLNELNSVIDRKVHTLEIALKDSLATQETYRENLKQIRSYNEKRFEKRDSSGSAVPEHASAALPVDLEHAFNERRRMSEALLSEGNLREKDEFESSMRSTERAKIESDQELRNKIEGRLRDALVKTPFLSQNDVAMFSGKNSSVARKGKTTQLHISNDVGLVENKTVPEHGSAKTDSLDGLRAKVWSEFKSTLQSQPHLFPKRVQEMSRQDLLRLSKEQLQQFDQFLQVEDGSIIPQKHIQD